MALSAYEEFYNSFKASTTSEARKAAGKGWALDNAELAAAYKDAATLANADEFRQMVEGYKAQNLWGYSLDPQYAMYGLTFNALLDGAQQSFQQGNPEKLYLVMNEYSSSFGPAFAHLFKAMAQNDNPGAVLQNALKAGVAGADKQKFLDASLSYAVGQNDPRIMEVLLDAGADANQKSHNGFPGQLIWSAAVRNAAPSTMKLLYDHGASFDDAIFMLRAQGGEKASIEKLYLYREKVTGEPSPETDANAKIQTLLAELLEVKQELTTLKKEVARLSRPPAKKALSQPK